MFPNPAIGLGGPSAVVTRGDNPSQRLELNIYGNLLSGLAQNLILPICHPLAGLEETQPLQTAVGNGEMRIGQTWSHDSSARPFAV